MKCRSFCLSWNLIFYPTETPLFDLLLGLNDAEKIGANLTFVLAVWLNQDLIENLDKKNDFAVFVCVMVSLSFPSCKIRANLFHSET